MKFNLLVIVLTTLYVFKQTDALSCLAGKTGIFKATQDCPGTNSTTYKCASGSYSIAGIAATVSLGCKENCVSGSLVPIDIEGVQATLDCCEENYCNGANSFKYNTIANLSVLISALLISYLLN